MEQKSMITLHIRFNDGTEMWRTVHRIDVAKDSQHMVIFDTPQQITPEQIANARVQVYILGQSMRIYVVT